mmetsp:Transcript_46503/g.104828  ORF Transcript_46503/g.104828 Transcript_46503/m.104828 type:complete len:294 (+) Transcript_46503:754-1635(+)
MRRDQRGEAGWDGSGLDGAGQDVTPFHTVSSDRIPLAILSTRMAVDEHFGHFISVARLRNTHGTRCKRPKLCAAQPAETHMWHHEDAGIGFNVFRAVVGQNASAIYVPVPAHYNDPGIIERSNPLDSNDQIWSMRAIFTHGVKLPLHYRILRQRWNMSRPQAELNLECHPCDRLPTGCNKHYGNWPWARVPCPQSSGVGQFCNVRPQDHFRCCNFPWLIPRNVREEANARKRQAIEPLAKGIGRKARAKVFGARRKSAVAGNSAELASLRSKMEDLERENSALKKLLAQARAT